MRVQRSATVLLLTVFLSVSSRAAAQDLAVTSDTLLLDLNTARRIALEQSPRIDAARALLQGARGERRQAGVYRYNPELQLKASSLIDPGDLGTFEGLLTQEFEWAGQWGPRKAAAEYGVAAAESGAMDVVRVTVYEAEVAYFRAVTAEHRLAVRRLGFELSRRFLEAVEIRAREGAVSPMEVNLARIEAGRARAGERSANRAVVSAKLDLARVLGLEPGRPIRIVADSTAAQGPVTWDLDSLVAVALTARPDLQAAEAKVAKANESRRLASREAIPNLQISAVAARGGLAEDVTWGLRFGLPVPLWNRNQGLVDLGRAEEDRAEAERASIELLVRTEVAASLEAYRSASEELRVFEAEVLMPARSNQSLLETAYAAGRLDLATALLLRTQLLDAELEYWDAWFAERSALSALQAAIGGAPPGLNPEF
jgi:cobalt-zinc-cadmium efflux system outer membrane protein